MKALYFLSLLLVGLTLGPSLAHLLELPNKIGLAAQDYLTVQQIYRGWAWLGVLVFPAIGATLGVVFAARKLRGAFALALLALICLAAAQLVFWAFTYPANVATENWTLLPQGWEALRARWEYSHATGALLNVAALAALIASLLAADHGAQVPRGMRRS